MSNAFARAYYKNIARSFEKWKIFADQDKHSKAILKRTMEHWLKAGGKYLLTVFANWKALCKINDTKKTIAQIENQMGDAGLV